MELHYLATDLKGLIQHIIRIMAFAIIKRHKR